MNTVKIYNVIASVLIVLLVVWVKQLKKDLHRTEVRLDECYELYNKEVDKNKAYNTPRDLDNW